MSPELHQVDGFMADMDSMVTDYCFRRPGDVPSEVMDLYEGFEINDPVAARVVLGRYFRAVKPDTQYYEESPVIIFYQHRKGRDVAISDIDIRN